jgi:hypothetical protein
VDKGERDKKGKPSGNQKAAHSEAEENELQVLAKKAKAARQDFQDLASVVKSNKRTAGAARRLAKKGRQPRHGEGC